MVYLVGAGPGDPGLITVKGLEIIRQCDTIIYDRLGTYQLLEMTRPDCRRIYVGKKAGSHYKKQSEINEILLEEGQKGNMVVRLKGGDPFVFGRGGEEAIALLEAGIPFQIVPGITSAVAVPEVCGIPVTHRGTSRSFHVITGHRQENPAQNISGETNTEDEHIVYQEGTSVFLMGLGRLPHIMARLADTGAPEDLPVAVISKGTLPGQRIVRGNIKDIAQKVAEAELGSPAIIVAGANAALDLTAPDRGPLQNIHVGLVGTPKLREKMRTAIDALGGQSYGLVDMRVVETPHRDSLREALEHIEDYSWLAFTSQNTITLFFKWMKEWRIDARRLAHLKLAVVGSGTREALQAEGYVADLVPEEYTTSALARELAQVMNKGERLLLPRAVQGSASMLNILDEAGVIYQAIPVYDVVGQEMESMQYLKDLDVVAFVSASGVKSFMDVLGNQRRKEFAAYTSSVDGSVKRLRIAALGEVTEKALESAGCHADIIPDICDIDHLIQAIAENI